MPSRMDRYTDNTQINRVTRSQKNKDLYQNVGNNTRYTDVSDVTNSNAFEIDNINSDTSTTRESYRKIKEYSEIKPVMKEKKELDDFNYLYQDRNNKIYDINRVLEEARKNRGENPDLESKRKLTDDSYNIIKSSTPEELEKFRKERIQRQPVEDEEELRELIDTITTKTLAGEIDKATTVNLLSDLMATNVLDKVDAAKEPEEDEEVKEDTIDLKELEQDKELALSKEILDKEQLEKIQQVKDVEEENTLSKADSDFYTKSMDLSDKDFETTDDFVEEKTSIVFKIFATIIILAALAVAGYFIWKAIK